MDILTHPTMGWLPPVVLGSIILIAALIGFWNGWKTALYFFGWNLVGLVAVVLSIHFAYDTIVGKVPENISDIKARQLVQDNEEILKPVIIIVTIIASLLVFNLLGFLIYWFFRKKLKRSIKAAKENGQSTMTTRFFGASIGVITALPIALSATMLSTAVSPKTDFNENMGKLTKVVTFGQAPKTDEGIKELVNLVNIAKNAKEDQGLQNAIQAAFGNAAGATQVSPKTAESLSQILNSKVVTNSLPLLVSSLNIDPKKAVFDISKTSVSQVFTNPLVTDAVKKANLIAAIKKAFPVNTNDAKITEFFKTLGIF